MIYTDFEQAINSYISIVFPNTTRKYCRLHLSQSMWRKIQTISLGLIYKNKKKNTELGIL